MWEELWIDCPAADRRFVQALIQAAVALYHSGGKPAGATGSFSSGREYMEPYRPAYRGLDVDRFWRQWTRTSPRPSPEPANARRSAPPHLSSRRPAMTDLRRRSDFAGTARLFPLPNLVLFPHVVQGLHIFEPRYRQIDGRRGSYRQLIALALLSPAGRTTTTTGRRSNRSRASAA